MGREYFQCVDRVVVSSLNVFAGHIVVVVEANNCTTSCLWGLSEARNISSLTQVDIDGIFRVISMVIPAIKLAKTSWCLIGSWLTLICG